MLLKTSKNCPRSTAGMQEVEQRMEQLPTTAGMQEVEQRMEQLPSVTFSLRIFLPRRPLARIIHE
jgi:hypothetical protein